MIAVACYELSEREPKYWVLDVNLKREECGEFAHLFPDLLQDFADKGGHVEGVSPTHHTITSLPAFSKYRNARPGLSGLSRCQCRVGRAARSGLCIKGRSGLGWVGPVAVGGCPFDCVYFDFTKKPIRDLLGRAGRSGRRP
ncbi:hypothetical protein J6590_019634 [Homalodisca vitripennis]|nr:hypothetical protein J6590_019634 [Homalodisca vitripennis]